MLPSVGLAPPSAGAQGRKDFTSMLIKAHSSAVHFAAGQRESSAWQLGGPAWQRAVTAGCRTQSSTPGSHFLGVK